MNLVTVSRVQRNPTVKSEIQMRNFEASIPVGFFCYPISQAADITAFNATAVSGRRGSGARCSSSAARSSTNSTAVYGETLTDAARSLLPSNKACLRLPGIGRQGQDEQVARQLHLSGR